MKLTAKDLAFYVGRTMEAITGIGPVREGGPEGHDPIVRGTIQKIEQADGMALVITLEEVSVQEPNGSWARIVGTRSFTMIPQHYRLGPEADGLNFISELCGKQFIIGPAESPEGGQESVPAA